MTDHSKKAALGAAVGALLYVAWILLAEVMTASNTLQPLPLQVPDLMLRLALAPLLGGAAGATYAYVSSRLGRARRARALAGGAAGAAFAGLALVIALIRGGTSAPPLVMAAVLVGCVLWGSVLGLVVGRATPRRYVAKKPL